MCMALEWSRFSPVWNEDLIGVYCNSLANQLQKGLKFRFGSISEICSVGKPDSDFGRKAEVKSVEKPDSIASANARSGHRAKPLLRDWFNFLTR